ncbi:MAG: hypothetical protein ACR2LK_10660 [Solirubrobacteraceae bacterium]
MTVCRLLLAMLVLGCLNVAPAQAAPDQVSIIMDDDELLYRGDRTSVRTLTTARSLGAEVVRATVLWRVVGEGANYSRREIRSIKNRKLRRKAIRQRRRFEADNPRRYPRGNWDRYDNLVKEATKLGMRVYFNVTGPGPISYAHKRAPRSQRRNAITYKPIATRFGRFVEAVGKRYSGSYRDENGTRERLPRVSTWSIWNEPNQAGWLSPQWEKIGGEMVPSAPAQFRRLFLTGRKALAETGHGDDAILLGETAPAGSNSRGPRRSIRPVPFLRELACVDPDGKQYEGKDAKRRNCDEFDRFGPLQATAFAHHPYTQNAAPTIAPRSPDNLTMGNIGLVGKVLDTVSAQSGGRIPANLPVLLTEFGYETKPDPRNGISFERQAEYLQLAEFLAYNEPRVKATTQFQITDARPLRRFKRGSRNYWFTYQSGLFNAKGRAKPAAFAYALPFLTYPSGAGMTGVWGQLRFRPNGPVEAATVFWHPTVDRKQTACGSPEAGWVQQGAPLPTSPRGYFSGVIPTPGAGGEYCAAFRDPKTGKIINQSLSRKP